MKELSHKFISFGPRVLAALLAMLFLYALALRSSAQTPQNNRQLKRDQAQQEKRVSQRRVALVIGNGAYTNAPPLKNPPNDARAMAATLKALGFEVSSGINASQREMKRLIREFGQTLKSGGSGLFYYAGHGVQSNGRNYLIPVDADIQSEAEVEDSSVDVNLVLNYIDEAQNGLNIVILDACRNNPFARSFRSAGSGLALVDAPTGTLIAYATAPGRVAADGAGDNGLYTSELLKQMRVPGLSVTEMFMRVRAEVMKQTSKKQVPWEASSLVGTFYFTTPRNADATSDAAAKEVKLDAVAVEQEYWNTIKSSTDAEDFRDYLKEYPTGAHVVIARSNLRRMEAVGKTSNTGATNASSTATKTTSRTNPPPKPQAVVKNQMGMELVFVPPGSFEMGSNNGSSNEKPVHRMTIGQGFYMGKYEMTQAQWQAVMGSNPSYFKGDENLPVENVSWNNVQEFINKLNEMNDGYRYRLPTEAEWEYACRAGTTGDFYAQDPDDIGWYSANSGQKTHRVGSKQPNAFGLYDTSGNVYEWCGDWYVDTYEGAPADGSARLSGGDQKYRVLRGGSWSYDSTFLSSASRSVGTPGYRSGFVGFRLVAVVRTQ